MNIPLLNLMQRGNAVIHAVKRHICIAGRVLRHRLENTARCREEARTALLFMVHLLRKLDILSFQPVGQLFKGQNRIHDAFIILRLILFGDARTDEDRLCVRVATLDIGTMRLHRGKYIRKIRQFRREVLLNQQVNGVAAGSDDHIPPILAQHPFIFGLDNGCADSGFLRVGKAEFLEGCAHGTDADTVIIGDKRGGDAYIDRRAALQKHLDLLGLIHDLFCILRTYDKAVPAKDTFVIDNMRLVARKADRLNRAVANALIAVFTVGFFQRQTIRHGSFSLCPYDIQNLILKELVEVFLCNTGRDFIIHRDGYADTITLAGAKAAGKCNFVFKMIVCDGFFQKLDNILRSLDIAGATDADLYNHGDAHTRARIDFSKKSSTLSGHTE